MIELLHIGAASFHGLWQDHARCSWDEEAQELVAATTLYDDPRTAAAGRSRGIYVPVDIPFDPSIPPVSVDCFGTQMAMLHPFERREFPGFEPLPDCIWLWRNASGVLMPAFNLCAIAEHFLGFGEDRQVSVRDPHGRLPMEASTLFQMGLLTKPLLNIYLFALLSAARRLHRPHQQADPSCHVRPPILVLSHDCDQLRGNDLFTQGARIVRFLAPLKRLRPPAFVHLRHAFANALYPHRYYLDDALKMVAAERRHGLRSTFYFLNGRRGRFGARSGSAEIAQLSARLPEHCEQGIHYNYRYSSSSTALAEQKSSLEQIIGRAVRSGRAHYLAFDPTSDFATLDAVGIENDESLGFSSCNGYRLAFAGAYRAWRSSERVPVVEIPMTFMDSMAPSGDAYDVLEMGREIERVGGVITILFHPGSYDNPEHPDLQGLYDLYLEYFAGRGYRNLLASEVGELVRGARCQASCEVGLSDNADGTKPNLLGSRVKDRAGR